MMKPCTVWSTWRFSRQSRTSPTANFQKCFQKRSLSTPRKPKYSLALSVFFKHPALGMSEYEILSRASAFLLRVDGGSSILDRSMDASSPSTTEGFLQSSQKRREERSFRHKHKYTPVDEAADGSPRKLTELGWLEYVPREARPNVHIVASSHVLAPFL